MASDSQERNARRVLSDHIQDGKTFTPPLMALGNVSEYSWFEDMLPDFLWVSLMLGRRSDWNAVHSALDVLDRFAPDGRAVVDGRLSSFSLIEPKKRDEARRALQADAPHALPTSLGDAIGLYQMCPARWLYEDWLEANEPDESVALPLLRSFIEEHPDKRGVRETRLRMAALARHVIHQKIVHSGSALFELMPRYPTGLTADKRLQVESVARSMWSGIHMSLRDKQPSCVSWPRDFWAHNRQLTGCVYSIDEPAPQMPVDEKDDGPIHVESPLILSEILGVFDALDQLGTRLRDEQLNAFRETNEDETAEVLFGFASRMYRVFYEFIQRPSSWSPATAGYFLRALLDARIVSAWLISRNDPELIAAYREYGLGQLKLLKEHIEADLDDADDPQVQGMLEHIDARVNFEREDWAQSVNVGSFSGVSIRRMAIEADLKREYDLGYAPLSSESHGEWPAVRDHDTVECVEALHGRHRIGAFRRPSRSLGPQPVEMGFDTMRDGITAIFDKFGLDVAPDFEPVKKALTSALYEPEPGSSDSPDSDPHENAPE